MKNDRRTRRTKKLLKNAFIELLLQKKITELSIKELCEQADINRGTFYLHYTDIYDLKRELEDEILNQLESLILNHPSLQSSEDSYLLFLDMFQLAQENAALLTAFMGNNGDISFLNKMQLLFRDRYLEILLPGKKPANTIELEYSYNFMASGFTSLVESWLTAKNQLSPEEMAVLMNKIVYDGLPSLLSFL